MVTTSKRLLKVVPMTLDFRASTEDPMWGYPVFVLGAISSFLEPFCGHLSPKLDKLCSRLTFEIPPRRALRGGLGLDFPLSSEFGTNKTVRAGFQP